MLKVILTIPFSIPWKSFDYQTLEPDEARVQLKENAGDWRVEQSLGTLHRALIWITWLRQSEWVSQWVHIEFTKPTIAEDREITKKVAKRSELQRIDISTNVDFYVRAELSVRSKCGKIETVSWNGGPWWDAPMIRRICSCKWCFARRSLEDSLVVVLCWGDVWASWLSMWDLGLVEAASRARSPFWLSPFDPNRSQERGDPRRFFGVQNHKYRWPSESTKDHRWRRPLAGRTRLRSSEAIRSSPVDWWLAWSFYWTRQGHRDGWLRTWTQRKARGSKRT